MAEGMLCTSRCDMCMEGAAANTPFSQVSFDLFQQGWKHRLAGEAPGPEPIADFLQGKALRRRPCLWPDLAHQQRCRLACKWHSMAISNATRASSNRLDTTTT